MRVGFFFRDLVFVDQGLNIGMIERSLDQFVAVVMIDSRIARMHPMALAAGIDEEGGYRAVRLLFGGYGSQLDDQMRFFDDLAQE